MAERYGSYSGYYWARFYAVSDMMAQGLLLSEDAFSEFTRGLSSASNDYGLKDLEDGD